MKHALFTLLLLISINLFAQKNSGLGFNYQAVIRSYDGSVLSQEAITLKFSLLPGQHAQKASWVETHTVKTDEFGTINIRVGKGERVDGEADNFSAINFSGIYYWMKTEIQESSGFREISFTQLPSTPYAESSFNSGVPVGTIISFAGEKDKIPEGWMFCDGREVERSEFIHLYDAIGTAWGYGNGSTTFNIPDLRGLIERCVSEDSNKDPDAEDRLPITEGGNSGNLVGSYQADAIQNVTGNIVFNGRGTAVTGTSGPFLLTGGLGTASNYGSDQEGKNIVDFDLSRVARTSSETRPKNVYVYKIIKYQ